ncbi:MAG TPA: glycosyltransferase [Solirubrobacteraceae bacterium]|jgi:glycosyltransferase involved in cell wall biosynthesis|nr:glycosyltransferase [Solirubrobacteraceae bacterium]
MTEITVVIPTHQRRESLRRALASLETQTLAAETYEVVVGVDRSTDGTTEMLKTLALPYLLRVVETPGQGRASALNAALRLAEGNLVVMLDDDMQVVPQFLERHRSHHPPGSRRCVMGAVPVRISEASPRAARHIATNFDAHMKRLAEPGHVYVPRDFYSGNASVFINVIAEVGWFDERFDAYGNEDVELGVRLRLAGVEFGFAADAVAHQDYGKDLVELAQDTVAKGTTTVRLARTHPDLFAMLRLANPKDGSRAWLAARSVLLALTRRRVGLPQLIFRVAGALERAGLWRYPLFYRAVLDYAFWAGVEYGLNPAEDSQPLVSLATELQRGPLRLLLD